MFPVLLKVGSITIYSYGVLVASAFLIGIFTAVYTLRRQGLYADKVWDLAVWIIVAAVLGGRTFYVIEFFDYFKDNLLEIFMVWHGGLVFFGGLTFGIVTAVLFIKKHKFPFWKFLDSIAPATILGYAVGRLGCFLNGCCYGIETTVPWAVHFPHLSGLRHPTQLYASGGAFIAFCVLWFLLKKKKFDGQIFSFAALYYGVYRFLNEILRVNPRYLFNLSAAQLISICLVGFAVFLLIYLPKKALPK